MKRALAAALAALSLAACGQPDPATDTAPAADQAAAPAAAVADAPAPKAAATTTAAPAVPGGPGFAPLYPGAVVTTPATTAVAPDGSPGAVVTFTTPDSPDQVIAFYRQHAEAAGLTQLMALNRGEARAYGAAKDGGDVLLNVVADPVAEGETSVQLSWTGR